MDWVSIGGIVFAWTAIIVALTLEGVDLLNFIALPAFLIVFGGSVGAAVSSFDWNVVRRIPRYLAAFLTPGIRPSAEHVIKFYEFSNTARREGILALEDSVSSPEHNLDEFTAKGLQLVIDGVEPDTVADVLEEDIKSQKEREAVGAEIFELMGGYSPTIGIIGTIMGMMFALQQLGTADAQQLGHYIAMAFVATFYGLAFANLVFLPMSSKLQFRIKGLEKYRMLTLKGLLNIQSGANPRIVVEQLSVFLEDDEQREQVKKMASERG